MRNKWMPWRLTAFALIPLAAMPFSSAQATKCHPRSLQAEFTALDARWHAQSAHPLVAQAFDVRDLTRPVAPLTSNCTAPRSILGVFDQAVLIGHLNENAFLLLGEIHDNPEHHAVRALFLREGAADAPNTKSPIAFEQIRADQQPALDQFAEFEIHAAPMGSATDLLRFLDWDKSPWSKTADYRPLFETAITNGLPVTAADPPRDLMRKAAKEGLDALPAVERTRLGLDTQLSDAQNAASLAEIEASHCGMIPKSAHANMAFAQRYRDAHMADALLRATKAHGAAVLLAGNGHVRADRGVPWYLHQRAPDAKVISVLFIEVEDDKINPAQYLERDESGKPTADYLVFTPKPSRDHDPCDAMKVPAKAP